jgi:ubiquinone/menaquinone biosynthesis C-methylase UbiE
MMPAKHRSVCWAAAAACLVLFTPALTAQLAPRPAEDWVKTMDGAERIAGLRIDEIVDALKIRPGAVVADLGAGAGAFVGPFGRAVGTNGKVYAVDIDRDFFPYIEQKAQAAGVRNVETVLGQPGDPRLPAEVDLAFIHDVIHHIEDRAGYVRAVAKYLKPGGRIAIIDFHASQSPHRNDPSLLVSKEQASAWLTAAGFKLVEDVAMYTDKWFVIYGR